MHPRFELPPPASDLKELSKRPPVCHSCGELGHKMQNCPKLTQEQREIERQNNIKNQTFNHYAQKSREFKENATLEVNQDHHKPQPQNPNNHHHQHPHQSNVQISNHGPFHHNHHQPRAPFQPRKLEDITCFKCGMKGHYANRCYSFLNNSVDANK